VSSSFLLLDRGRGLTGPRAGRALAPQRSGWWRRAAKPEVGLYWHELLRNSGAEVDPFAPIMRLLGRTNPFILEKAALVLGRILSLKVHTPGVEVEEVTEADEVTQRHLLTFTEWIFHQLNSAHSLELSHVRCARARAAGLPLAH